MQFKIIFFLILLINLNFAFFVDYKSKARFPSFQEFKNIYQKKYQSTQEEDYRRSVFQKNKQELIKIKNECLSCGITQFSDLTQTQFQGTQFVNKELYSSSDMQTLYQIESAQKFNNIQEKRYKIQPLRRSLQTSNSYPSSMNWQYRDVITSVKAQGKCSACWAFTTAALAESTMLIRKLITYKLDLSQQFLLQCTKDTSCQKGTLQQTMATILRLGAPSQQSYPYDFSNQHQNICKANSIINIKGYRYSKYHATDQQIIALLNKSPLGVVISSNGWQNYNPSSSQVFSCTNDSKINHSVLLVGYSETYWIAKNSWGSNWGLNGYIYVNRSRENSANCLIGSSAHYFQQSCLVSDCSHCMTATSCLTCNVGFYRYYPIHDNQTITFYQVICKQCIYQNCLKCFSSAFKDKFVGKCQQCEKGYTLNMTDDIFTCFYNANHSLFTNCLTADQNVCTQCYSGFLLNDKGLCDLIQQNGTEEVISGNDDKNDKNQNNLQISKKTQSKFPIFKVLFILFFLSVILLILWIRRKILVRRNDEADPLTEQKQKGDQNNENNQAQGNKGKSQNYHNFNSQKQNDENQNSNQRQVSINVQKGKEQQNDDEDDDPNMNSATNFAKIQEEP